MNTIHKYPLVIEGEQTIDCPAGAKPLFAGLDPTGQPCLWAEVHTDDPITKLKVFIVGTGNPMGMAGAAYYLSSFVQGPFMWHVLYGRREGGKRF